MQDAWGASAETLMHMTGFIFCRWGTVGLRFSAQSTEGWAHRQPFQSYSPCDHYAAMSINLQTFIFSKWLWEIIKKLNLPRKSLFGAKVPAAEIKQFPLSYLPFPVRGKVVMSSEARVLSQYGSCMRLWGLGRMCTPPLSPALWLCCHSTKLIIKHRALVPRKLRIRNTSCPPRPPWGHINYGT